MGEVITLTPPEPRRLYSWWWDSHISPKNSRWLQENLTDIDSKVKMMIKLIEEDADSFSRRAEMYYEKRPELMKLVEHFYRAYRALAEQYDHATAELRHAHHVMSTACPSHSPLPPALESPPLSSTNLFSPDLSPPTEGETEDVRLLKAAVEQLTTERDTLLNERDALLNDRETLEASTAVHEAEARTLKERCLELEKTALLGWKADIEYLSLEIRRGISALGKWGADIGDIKDGIKDLKMESADSLRNLLEENLNLRKEKEDLLENIQCERDTVYRELDGLGKLLECSEQTTHADQLRGITVNLVKLLEKKTRLEERQLAYADIGEVRASLDGERRRLLSFVLFCGARLILVEDEVRRLRQLAADTGGRYAELAKVSAELIAELEGECLIQKAEAEFLSGENGRLEAGISEISGFFHTLYTDGLVRAEEEREKLAVENSVLCVLLEGMSVSGAEAYRDIEKENEDLAIEVLDTSGMCVVLEDFGKEKEEEGGRLRRDLDRVRRVNRRLTEELRKAGAGRGREVEIWEGEAACFYFDLQVSAVWELVFENTVSQMVLRCSHLEKEICLNRTDAEKMRERVRELEAEVESLRTRLSGYVTAMDSLEGFLHPDQGRERSEAVDSSELKAGLSDIERMQTRLKKAAEEMERVRAEEKQKNKKLEAALKLVEELGWKKPKRGPLKPAHHSPCRPGVVVKDIILDRVSKEPPLVGFQKSSWLEEGAENGGMQLGDGSWTISYSSPGSSSGRSNTDEVEKESLQKSEQINDWWRTRRPALCGCLPTLSTRPNN